MRRRRRPPPHPPVATRKRIPLDRRDIPQRRSRRLFPHPPMATRTRMPLGSTAHTTIRLCTGPRQSMGILPPRLISNKNAPVASSYPFILRASPEKNAQCPHVPPLRDGWIYEQVSFIPFLVFSSISTHQQTHSTMDPAPLLPSGSKRKIESPPTPPTPPTPPPDSDLAPFPLLDLPADVVHLILHRVRVEDRIWLAMTCSSLYNSFKISPSLLTPYCNLYTGPRSFASPLPRLQYAIASSPTLSPRLFEAALSHALSVQDFPSADRILPLSYYIRWRSSFIIIAAEDGNLPAIQWLLRRNFDWDILVPYVAAKAGHLHIIQWLHDRGYPLDYWAREGAATGGHLHVLQWLHEKDYPLTKETLNNAAAEGQLHILQWLHENGFPLTEETFHGAACEGHLHILQWLYEQECPWDRQYILQCFDVPDHIKAWVSSLPD